MAEVEWTERYYWGIRTVVAMVPADRVRLADEYGMGMLDWASDLSLLPTAV